MVRLLLAFILVVPLLGACNGGGGRRRVAGDAELPNDTSVTVDSAIPDATADAPPTDGSVMDTSTPPVDSSAPDTTVVPMDTGTPPVDSSVPDTTVVPMDTGTPAVTIEDVQRGRVAEGTTVTFSGVIVTALYSGGAWVQDPSLGPTYSGVKVYEGTAPTVSVGDRVDVTGTYMEYYGDTEIESATITRLGAGTPIVPTNVTVAMAASEAYEGVLVHITDASTYLSFYDCTADNPACTDTDVWQVSSTSNSVLVADYVYESADWLSHIGESRDHRRHILSLRQSPDHAAHLRRFHTLD